MPRSLLAVFRFECIKALHARMTWAVIALPVLVTLLAVWWQGVSRRIGALVEESSDVAAAEPSAYLSFAAGAGSGLVLGGILLLLYASMIVANEGQWRTFKVIMLRPHARWEWIVGKFAVLLLLALALLASVTLAAWAASLATGSFADIAEEKYVYFTADFMTRETLRALALSIPPLIALAAFGLMFSTMTDHPGIATAAGLGSYIVLETAKGSLREGRVYLFNSFVPSLLDTSYFKALRGFSEGMSDTGWDERSVWFNIGTPLASAVVCVVVSLILFRRREFAL